MTASAAPSVGATRRILEAARALALRGGPSEISMGDVAAAASVSKALVHYHFHDKTTLLVALVDDIGRDVIDRTRRALSGARHEQVLDSCWDWISNEMGRGDIRVLVSLGESASEPVREACRRIAGRRREEHAVVVEEIYAQLGLSLRVPVVVVADTLTAFLDGMVFSHALDTSRNERAAFDVLWLALLTLAE